MAVWLGEFMLVKHKCGETHFISWSTDACYIRGAELIGGHWWIGNVVNTCKCGVNIGQFNSKEWSEA